MKEIEQESWAKSMKKLLLLACNYQHRYQSGIPKNIVTRLNQCLAHLPTEMILDEFANSVLASFTITSK